MKSYLFIFIFIFFLFIYFVRSEFLSSFEFKTFGSKSIMKDLALKSKFFLC